MGAALAAPICVSGYFVGQSVMLAGGKGREAQAVTVRAIPDAVEPRYMVTLDDGLCAGLRLWAAESELSARRIGKPEGRA